MGAFPLMHMEADPKIRIFGDKVITATSGPVGYAQRLHDLMATAEKGNVFNNLSARDATTNISKRFITDLQESKSPTWGAEGIRFGALCAAANKDGPYLAEFGQTDFQAELK
jgi:hypothetical protein